MSITTVGIIGAGTMGNGIAQACAVKGIKVVMVDISDAAVQKGLATVAGSLDRLIKKEKITAADKDAALARIKTSTSYDDLKAAQLVIEAATENYELKLKILKQVDASSRPEVIMASNTSSISITKLAAATSRADKLHRHALLQPRAHDGAGGDHPWPANQRRHARRREGHGRGAGQEPHHREERPGLCGQPHSWCP
jgi:3-hydroxyacyl-CoA dehydrogenase